MKKYLAIFIFVFVGCAHVEKQDRVDAENAKEECAHGKDASQSPRERRGGCGPAPLNKPSPRDGSPDTYAPGATGR